MEREVLNGIWRFIQMKVLNQAIFSRLSGATALTSLLAGTASIYALQAPESATLPFVCYNIQAGGDTNDTQNRLKNLVVFVRGYATTNATAGSIDAAIDTALHLVPFTGVTGWTNIWLAREQDLELVENPPTGGQIFMNGGLFRVLLDKT
jgi:hypothetical protein